MLPKHLLPTSITLPEFRECLSRYDSTIGALSASHSTSSTGKTLEELDQMRRFTLPTLIRARNSPHLTKLELSELLQCKLKRGKFRPLSALVASNEEKTVIAASKKAFAAIPEKPAIKDILAGLKEVIVLKGIGPATASYILATFQPLLIPVFSDEGFRWAMFEEKPGGGWDRKLKYDVKEYSVYLEKMKEISGRLGVEIEEVERVGFVLGREAISDQNSTVGGKKRKLKTEPEDPMKQARSTSEQTSTASPNKRTKDGEKKPTVPASTGRVLRSRNMRK